MANESKDEILLTVGVDEAALETRIVELRKQITGLLSDKEALNKANKAGAISSKVYGEAMGRIKDQSKLLTAELSKQEGALVTNQKQQGVAAGMVDLMRKNVSGLFSNYKDLTKAQDDNRGATDSLISRMANLNKGTSDQNKGFKESGKSIEDYARSVTIAGVNAGELKDAFSGGVQSALSFGKAIFSAGNALKVLIAIPIVAVFAALVAFIQSTDEGADKLAQAVSFLTAAFDSLLKGIAPIGKLLVDLFTAPTETIKKLIDGTDEYSVSLGNVASAAYRAGKAQAEYTKTMQDVEDAENSLIAKREQVGLQVDQAILKVKDRSLSEKQKIAILREAGKAEADLSKITLKNANDAYQAILKLNKERKTSQELTDDETIAQLNAEAALIKAKRESLNTQQSIRNRETAQIEEQASKQKAAADKAKQAAKDAAQDRVYEAELAILTLKKRGEDTLEIEAELTKRQTILIQRRGDLEKSGLAKNSAQRKLIEAKVNSELLELAQQQATKISEIAYKTKLTEIDTLLAFTQSGSEKELDLRVRSINAERVKQVEAARATIKDKENFLNEEARINAVAARQTGDLRQAFEQAQVNREAAANAARLQTQLDLGDQTIANERDVAEKRIDLEEDTQIKLLEVERKYGQVNDSEYLNRLNAIQSKAIAARRDLSKQIQEDERTKEDYILDAQLSRVREGSKAELDLQKAKLKVERERAIANAKGTKEEIDKINGEFDKKEKKLQEAYQLSVKEKVVQTTQQAISTFSTIVEAQNQAIFNAFDKQQQAAINSAGANADLRERIEQDFAKKKAKLEEDANKRTKRVATAQNAINVALAITKAFSELGPIAGAIATALILAQGAAQQAIIEGQKFAEGGVFADGGVAGYLSRYFSDGKGAYVRGPGTGKSDSINARISNGESIVNAKSTAMFYDQLSAINVAGGGRAFPGAMGGSEVPQLGGFAFGGVKVDTNADAITASILAGLKDANFVVSVTDIHKVEKDLDYAVAAGNI